MKMALFFTEGVSMQIWNNVGMFDREIKPYNILAEKFEKIYFVTYGDEKDLVYEKFLHKNIEILPKKSKLPSKIYSLILPFIYRRELSSCDVYKTNQMQGSWTALISKMLYGKKLVVRCGYQWSQSAIGWKLGWIKNLIVTLIEKLCYAYADVIIVTSESAKEYVADRYKIAKNKINCISNYIDVALFKPIACEKIPNSILYVGRLEEDKNISALVESVVGLDVVLNIYGNGSLLKKLEQFSLEKKIRVNFLGNVANNKLPEEMNKHDLFVLPSHYEGNPKVLLEAMACGLSVIGTNVTGINNIIVSGVNGILCNLDSHSIKNAIETLLKDQSLREKIAQGARNYILNNCGLAVIIEKENKLYQNIFN